MNAKQNKMVSTLEFAKKYVRHGWKPLPVPVQSKNPNFNGWQKLVLSESDLPNHFNGKPQNIGVLLGEKSNGLIDIDLDSPEAVKIADFFLPDTAAIFGRLSKEKSHRLYYSDFPKTEKFEFGETIVEIRSNGGQTIFPPSIHESNEQIEWFSQGEPKKIEAMKLRRAVAFLASACAISKYWKNGNRHELSLAVSGVFLRNGFDIEETKHFIKAVCFACNDEETKDRLKSVETTAESIQAKKNFFGFPKLADLTEKKLVESICKWLEIEPNKNNQVEPKPEFKGEPKPLDSILKPVEKIDEDCLPKILVDWLQPSSKVIGCPFDFLVLSAIVTAGSLIGSRIRLKALQNSDWFVVPNLYGGIVGLPSTKKTPALDETRKPILELQNKVRKEFAEKQKDFEIESKFYDRETTAIYREKLGLEETKEKIKALPEPKKPILKRFETNDITTPKLAQFLAENPNGLLQFRDELTGWLKSLDADYDTNARAFVLELWKGGISYEKARVGDGEIQINSGTLSIIGGIQPSKLQKYVSEVYSFDNSDGFLQRFLFAYPDIEKKSEKLTEGDYRAMQEGFAIANETFGKLAEFDFNGKVIGANGDKFHLVKFAANAQKEIDEWKEETEDEAENLQIEDEAFSSFLYKLPKNCFAIALIFHCLENINKQSFPEEITLLTALKAITYIEFLKTHARRVFSLGENLIFALANTLLGKIKNGDLKQGFTSREVTRKQWSGLKSKDTVQDVLSLLIDYGYLRELKTDDGRPTTKYYIHSSLEVKNEVEK